MRPLLLPPPVPGVPLTDEARKVFLERLRRTYRHILHPKAFFSYPRGWSWILADLVHMLDQLPDEEREALPLRTVAADLENARLLLRFNALESSAASALIDELSARCREVCQECGGKPATAETGPWRTIVRCRLCRLLGEENAIKKNI